MGRVKWFLMIGGVFILTAIVLRISGVSGVLPVVLFSLGGLLKVIYLIIGVRSGRFKIGLELILLPIGVALVLTGLFVKSNPELKHMYGWLIASGVILKSTFLFLFFRRQRKQVI